MAILITGGAGFIGSHLVERFLAESSEKIVCLDNYNDYYDPAIKRKNVTAFENNPQVTMVEETFCNQDAMHRLFEEQEIDEVFHFGAYAGVRPSIERPHLYEKANIEGTLCLLEAARAHPVERFVLASSSTVYGGGAGERERRRERRREQRRERRRDKIKRFGVLSMKAQLSFEQQPQAQTFGDIIREVFKCPFGFRFRT